MTTQMKTELKRAEENPRFHQNMIAGLIPISRSNPELESEAIRAGALFVEEDGDIRWYQRKRPQANADTPIGAILNKVDECQLECDGITRIVSYILHEADISHRVMIGSIKHIRTGACVKPHFWIELEDGQTIDYRAKMWLGDETDVPHGVFRMEEWTGVDYASSEDSPFSAGDTLGRILALVNGVPIDQMITDLSNI